jgi:CHAT domain-containing protein/tetratricopeptide (TPR) repeat protein
MSATLPGGKRVTTLLLIVLTVAAFSTMQCLLTPSAEARGPAGAGQLTQQYAELFRLRDAGKDSQVVELGTRLLDAVKAQYGDTNQAWDNILITVAEAFDNLGRAAEAEALLKHYLASTEKEFGADHTQIAGPTNRLAFHYKKFAQYALAEPLYRRALALDEKDQDNAHTADVLNNLAVLYAETGRYADAETNHKRALQLREAALGRDDPYVGQSLYNLGSLYTTLSRDDEAEALFKRALAISESGRASRTSDRKMAEDVTGTLVRGTLDFLGKLYMRHSRYAESEQSLKRSLEFSKRAPGNDVNAALALHSLATLYRVLGRFSEAEPLFRDALRILEKPFGADHPWVIRTIVELGRLYRDQARYANAEPLYQRALAARSKVLGTQHLDYAEVLRDLAALKLAQGEIDQSLAFARESIGIAAEVLATTGPTGDASIEATSLRSHFDVHLDVLQQAMAGRLVGPAAVSEAFATAQWAHQSTAAAALNKTGLRLAAGSDALASLVREQQDMTGELRAAGKAVIAEISRAPDARGSGLLDALRRRTAELEQNLARLNARLASEFPDYASLASAKPVSAEDVRGTLMPDEALVFFLLGEQRSQIFALTRSGFDWKTLPLGTQALSEKVAAFRHGLDVEALSRGLVRVECTPAEADKRGLSRIECNNVLATECAQASADDRGVARVECRRGLFDLAVAHELYETLLGPVEALIKDKRHLLVVPSGALTALPFHLLVAKKPAAAVPASADLALYRDAAWLIKRHAVTVLPSVASLRALRLFARKDLAGKPMIGFGDPVFDSHEPPEAGAAQRTASRGLNTRAFADFWQGGGFDRTKLSQLPRLWDTAIELREVGRSLGAPASDIHLRADASEATVKRAPLADYRIVYFATHGLVSGDVKGLAEPSLALTMPAQPSDFDDGLLTASEVAQLKLNADWVVLSACNTIAGDKPGAEALSGLARAFFYAGARALLVSHWSVDSAAATRLTTTTFENLKADPTIGRAEALRRAMLAYLNDASNPRNAYPAYWAPFELVGEGR